MTRLSWIFSVLCGFLLVVGLSMEGYPWRAGGLGFFLVAFVNDSWEKPRY